MYLIGSFKTEESKSPAMRVDDWYEMVGYEDCSLEGLGGVLAEEMEYPEADSSLDVLLFGSE